MTVLPINNPMVSACQSSQTCQYVGIVLWVIHSGLRYKLVAISLQCFCWSQLGDICKHDPHGPHVI